MIYFNSSENHHIQLHFSILDFEGIIRTSSFSRVESNAAWSILIQGN